LVYLPGLRHFGFAPHCLVTVSLHGSGSGIAPHACFRCASGRASTRWLLRTRFVRAYLCQYRYLFWFAVVSLVLRATTVLINTAALHICASCTQPTMVHAPLPSFLYYHLTFLPWTRAAILNSWFWTFTITLLLTFCSPAWRWFCIAAGSDLGTRLRTRAAPGTVCTRAHCAAHCRARRAALRRTLLHERCMCHAGHFNYNRMMTRQLRQLHLLRASWRAFRLPLHYACTRLAPPRRAFAVACAAYAARAILPRVSSPRLVMPRRAVTNARHCCTARCIHRYAPRFLRCYTGCMPVPRSMGFTASPRYYCRLDAAFLPLRHL